MISLLRQVMTEHLGIVRTPDGMEHARRTIDELLDQVQLRWQKGVIDQRLIELRDLAAVAWAITDQALRERESAGTHFLEAGMHL